MGKTYPKRRGPKKPRTPQLACFVALLALACTSALAGDYAHKPGSLPQAGDMALGGSLTFTNTLPEDACRNVSGPPGRCGAGTSIEQCETEYPMEAGIGLSFEFWADSAWSYQAGISFAEGGSPSAYSASAWHAPMGKGAGFFGAVGLAAASGTGIMSDLGAGLEFFPGTASVQLRADWYYDLDQSGNDDRGSYGLGVAIRKKW